MEELKIGYYVDYPDPKDGEIRTGLVINFDEDMVIVWSRKLKCPYPVPRMNIKKPIMLLDHSIFMGEQEGV